ncbi:MAG: hypothetical protein FD167_4079 [bacterium]|nr:MAG: hypothetical protein FD167_4079 [bacterium]
MSDYTKILYKLDGVIAHIILNRPEKRNALDDTIVAEIKLALKAANENRDIQVVVIE